jgi:phosphatidylserine/phosphatidylglycerophosphate/cardiolipin synthase-like enzyme
MSPRSSADYGDAALPVVGARRSGASHLGRRCRYFGVTLDGWFLTSEERGNPATGLDSRHSDGAAWTVGNEVTALVHGHAYFPELRRCVDQMTRGDLLMFTDWRGDPDQRVDHDGQQISALFAAAAGRGVVVKGLVWRSHLDRLSFSEQENRHLGEDINAAGGECLRDMRVRPGGSHHQKFVVLRHPARPEMDVAFVGGIDLCHSRFDGSDHAGDSQSQAMAKVYGARPPWHDVQLRIQGPAVGDVETVFRERWEDPAKLTRNPVDVMADVLRREDPTPGTLPPVVPDPAPVGSKRVQLLRTYPKRWPRYPFAPDGERSVARAYQKVVARAESLIYVEDQYFWAAEVVECFADALRTRPRLRLIAVIPHHPDQDGRFSEPPNLVGRQQALDVVRAAGGDRFAAYGIENHRGTPVYVHAKVGIIDDVWASAGSDNINRRSWTHDSELSCAVLDEELDPRAPNQLDRFGTGARRFARDLRLRLACEHLDLDIGQADALADPVAMFDAFRHSAETLQSWHDTGAVGVRPPGRLRPYRLDRLPARTVRWATPLYRIIYDPDGRPATLRRAHAF